MANFDPSWRYSWCYYPNQHIFQRGWRILTPHEDKDDDNDDGDDDDDDDDHDDCKCGATSGLGRTCFNIFGETTWNAMSTIQHFVVVLMASTMTVSKSGRLRLGHDPG